ncbi:aminotransferase class III-fold pyridoxal phosphate-dependent enzyme [Lonsdalea quercina]|uniref:aminotransferase class III-fold pyridoxal phosphate-dependent enzyme n=1 Tax=Lonsdalea quercina TaxID=71657 RepID=UPI003975E0FD
MDNNQQQLRRAIASTAAREYDISARPPFVVQSAKGAWLKDCDGRTILDMTSSNGTVLFGHRRHEIDQAVVDQIQSRGIIFPTTLSPQRIELAEQLVARYPSVEKAVFFRTGSDGTSAAIRMARAYTGRRIVLSSGYHGWHDWHRQFGQLCYDQETDVFHFGYNLQALSTALDVARDRIAAVIVTPELGWFPESHFNEMGRLCRAAGVPFILDEVMSGLRYGEHGVHGDGGVDADLMIVSKGLANGFALSTVAGKADLINAYDAAGLAGTYNKEVTSMAAALVALRIFREERPHDAALKTGAELIRRLQMAADEVGIPLWVTGPPLMFKTVFANAKVADAVTAECFAHGLFLECNGTHMINFAFGQPELAHAVSIFKASLEAVKTSGNDTGGDTGAIDEKRRKDYARSAFGVAFEVDLEADVVHALNFRRGSYEARS